MKGIKKSILAIVMAVLLAVSPASTLLNYQGINSVEAKTSKQEKNIMKFVKYIKKNGDHNVLQYENVGGSGDVVLFGIRNSKAFYISYSNEYEYTNVCFEIKKSNKVETDVTGGNYQVTGMINKKKFSSDSIDHADSYDISANNIISLDESENGKKLNKNAKKFAAEQIDLALTQINASLVDNTGYELSDFGFKYY